MVGMGGGLQKEREKEMIELILLLPPYCSLALERKKKAKFIIHQAIKHNAPSDVMFISIPHPCQNSLSSSRAASISGETNKKSCGAAAARFSDNYIYFLHISIHSQLHNGASGLQLLRKKTEELSEKASAQTQFAGLVIMTGA